MGAMLPMGPRLPMLPMLPMGTMLPMGAMFVMLSLGNLIYFKRKWSPVSFTIFS